MRSLAVLLTLALISIPFAGALDTNNDNRYSYPGFDGTLENPWDPVGPKYLEDIDPWWERSFLDSNDNGISDVLERPNRPESADITISLSRPVGQHDINLLDRMGLEVSAVLPSIDAIILHSVPTERLEEMISIGDVVFIEPLGIPVMLSDIANPTIRAKGSDMYSPMTAWDLGYSGEGVSVAVIDTGIDDEHPSLNGKFLGGVDMTKPDNLGVLFPQDGTYNPDDIQGHGSTCSGIAVGTGAPEEEYQGSAPGANLVDVRIGTKIGYAPGEFWVGTGVIEDPHAKDGTLRGIQWSIDNQETAWSNGGAEYQGIDIFSISWGVDVGSSTDGSDQYSRLLDAAVEEGAIVINAAGNAGPDNSGFSGLAASSRSIKVAATDDRNTMDPSDDVIAFYSSRGPRDDNNDGDPYNELIPDIAAPGTNITNMQPDTQRITGDASGNGYGPRGSGTSYATPLVAGVVALLLEANPTLEGETDVVREILAYTADRKKQPTFPELDPFWEVDFGYGVTDSYAAVRLAEETSTGNLDPRLQAHIIDVEGANFTKPFYHIASNSSITIHGYGWSKGGEYEATEYSLDDGDWKPVTMQDNGTFNPWTVDLSGLSKGTHTVHVRSTGGGRGSLVSWVELDVIHEEVEKEGIGGTGYLVVIILVIIAALAAGFFIFKRMKKPPITSA